MAIRSRNWSGSHTIPSVERNKVHNCMECRTETKFRDSICIIPCEPDSPCYNVLAQGRTIRTKQLMSRMINGYGVGSDVAGFCHSRTHRRQHGVNGVAGHFFSPSFPSFERSPPPMLSPQILLSLSNGAALHHPVTASPVIVAPQIAITRVEE